MKEKAFTLIELMIVVAILGILAAIVLPQVQGHTVQARESAAKTCLQIIRCQIEMYKMQHDNLPGYLSGTAVTNTTIFTNQLTGISNAAGAASSATAPTATYPLGPYLQDIPENPFNGLSTLTIYTSDVDISASANDATGWIYKTVNGEIHLNSTGTDNSGMNYYEY